MNTGRYSVHTLFSSSEIDQIIIPEIQRDYVWQEKNVKGLINSILSHFQEKKSLSLEILDCNRHSHVSQDIQSFLSEEYTRMVHSTRIGFIYAYHSPDYPGKYFLIDGQQRITTIFLLLLCAYKKAGMSSEYRKTYYASKRPKIDYKVREISHDFLLDFVEYQTSIEGDDNNVSFRNSSSFYRYYDEDVTTSSMLRNYACIEEIIESQCPTDIPKKEYYKELVKYVEYYIEFNYFDTNICEQGERLYLYMNSRGEELSVQESLRPTLVARSSKKLIAGEQWEVWQNFFWKQKGDNPNADKGFQEFLRWATFLHIICGTDNPILYNRKNNNETKQDYIRIEKRDGGRYEQQQRWIRKYQEDNKDFTIDFIGKVFDAVSRLEIIISKEKNGYISSHWLSYIDRTNDYPTLLACLAYLLYYPDAESVDVKRIGMFVKNCMYYDTNSKNPEMASVNIVSAVRIMHENGIRDIADIYKVTDKLAKNIFIEADRYKTTCMLTTSRGEWEEIFWSITDDNNFSSFLEGDTICLFEWADYQLEKFCYYYNELKTRIIAVVNRNDNNEIIQLHEKLLEYGDFAVRDGTGIGIPRYYLIKYPKEWTWINENTNIRSILKMYLDNEDPKRTGELYRLLIDEEAQPRSVLAYTEYMELLKSDENPPHIILPRIYQISGDNFRELMTQWVCQAVEQSKVDGTNRVVKEFDIDNETGQLLLDNIKGAYHLDMVYNWNAGNPVWSFKIGSRGKKYHQRIPNIINTWNSKYNVVWKEKYNDEKRHNEYFLDSALHDNPNESIHQRKQVVLELVNEIWECLSHN